jgi:uncharacterized phiE125 gp8 family phage protein
MTLRLITSATTLAVDVDEAKAHLRVTDSNEDDLIESMLWAAQDMVEQVTGRALMPQTWQLALDDWEYIIELTKPTVQSITSITYTDTASVVQTLAADQYTLLNDDFGVSRIVPAYNVTWPANRGGSESVKVTFVAGYANAIKVPYAIKAWIKLQVSAMYENREAESYSVRAVSTTVQMTFVDRLLDKYRVYV